LLVHGLEAVFADDQVRRPPFHVQQGHHLREHAVGVDVDGRDPAAIDHNLAAPRGWLGVDVRTVDQIATAEHGAGKCAGGFA
jgi:hypothetical protein